MNLLEQTCVNLKKQEITNSLLTVIEFNPQNLPINQQYQLNDYFDKVKLQYQKEAKISTIKIAIELSFNSFKITLADGQKELKESNEQSIFQISKVHSTALWFFFDKRLEKLKIGYGEPLKETELITYNLHQNIGATEVNFAKDINCLNICFLKQDQQNINVQPLMKDSPRVIRIHYTLTFPSVGYIIKENFQLENLLAEERKKFILPEMLPDPAKQLYHQIKNVTLEVQNFQFLGSAIHYSVTTKNCLLNRILVKKQNAAVGRPKKMSYLRIGLGDQIDSPGHQFVLEIWPPMHYSPIHKHANCFGMIKVLQGEINVKVYAILSTNQNLEQYKKPCLEDNFSQSSITWLAPKQFQIHQLLNKTPQTTITLQSYIYPKPGSIQFEKFEYINQEQNNQYSHHKFQPQSDLGTSFTWYELIDCLKYEWNNYYNLNNEEFISEVPNNQMIDNAYQKIISQ